MESSPTTRKPRARRTLSQALVITGIVIAVANMILAWVMMFTRPTDVAAESARSTASHARINSEASGSSDTFAEIVRPMVRSAQMKDLVNANVQTLTVAFSFALMSIGFSLLVMGIDGALNFDAGLPHFGRLVLTTASPGILCIVLSAGTLVLLIVLTQVTFGDTQEAARADAIRAEADARARLIDAEAIAKERENMSIEMTRSKREAEEQQSKFEHQLELERAKAARQK